MTCPHDGAVLNELPAHPGCAACPRCEYVATNRLVPGPRAVIPPRFQARMAAHRIAVGGARV